MYKKLLYCNNKRFYFFKDGIKYYLAFDNSTTNTHMTLMQFTHEYLSQYTHDDINKYVKIEVTE